MADFKPNIYPIMYWGLMYGLIAGFLLFILFLLSRFITLVWFPVFLTGLLWGGYRNYLKQKREANGGEVKTRTPLEELKEAAKDIYGATREMVAEQAHESIQRDEGAGEQAAKGGETVVVDEGAETSGAQTGLVDEAISEAAPSAVPAATTGEESEGKSPGSGA